MPSRQNFTNSHSLITSYNKAANQIFTVLDDLNLEWWPTEGTLIGCLRWGSNFGMTENGMLVTDTDIDLMVRVKDDQNWQVVKKEIEKRLKTLDPEWIKFESHNHDIGISREPKFSCYYNKRWGLKCYGNDDIHVDIHSYMVDEKNNRIFMDPVCNGNDKCANKYPFQKWGGYAPYRGLIVDDKGLFKKCKFGNMTLNCPYQSIKLLSNWNDKEYGTGDDLHLPRGNCVFKNSCWKNGDNTLSSTDKLRLKNIAKKLHDGGFESFYSYYDADKDFKMTNKPLTIITAYFDLGKNSKKGPEGSNKYLKWIPSLLSYSGPMIIFVDSKTIEYIKTIRNGLPTIIVPIEIEDLMCNKYSGKFQLQKGPWYKSLGNGNANEDKLAIIWNEKLNFLRQGIELSTFDTPYYAWYDIGYIRNGNKIPSSWPSESKLRMGGEKVNLLTFSPKSDWCQFPYHRNEKLSYKEPPHGVMLTGGFILGTPEALKKFYTLFYNTLDEMVATEEYTGNEQFTFSKCYCKNRDLFNLIKAVPHEFVDNDKWFYGVPYYLTDESKIDVDYNRFYEIMKQSMNVVYINLDSRKDRKKLVEHEFQQTPPFVNLTRFNAVKMKNKGGLGCSLSHISVLEDAMRKKLPFIVIIEDDFEFTIQPANAIRSILIALSHLRDDWDVLLLSTSKYNLKKTKVNSILSSVQEAQTTGAYIVNSRYYSTLLDNFKEGADKLAADYSQYEKLAIDQYWKKLQPKDKWFLIEPLIAKQRESFSDIGNVVVKYDF
jgi:glycosyl transferase family 25